MSNSPRGPKRTRMASRTRHTSVTGGSLQLRWLMTWSSPRAMVSMRGSQVSDSIRCHRSDRENLEASDGVERGIIARLERTGRKGGVRWTLGRLDVGSSLAPRPRLEHLLSSVRCFPGAMSTTAHKASVPKVSSHMTDRSLCNGIQDGVPCRSVGTSEALPAISTGSHLVRRCPASSYWWAPGFYYSSAYRHWCRTRLAWAAGTASPPSDLRQCASALQLSWRPRRRLSYRPYFRGKL